MVSVVVSIRMRKMFVDVRTMFVKARTAEQVFVKGRLVGTSEASSRSRHVGPQCERAAPLARERRPPLHKRSGLSYSRGVTRLTRRGDPALALLPGTARRAQLPREPRGTRRRELASCRPPKRTGHNGMVHTVGMIQAMNGQQVGADRRCSGTVRSCHVSTHLFPRRRFWKLPVVMAAGRSFSKTCARI